MVDKGIVHMPPRSGNDANSMRDVGRNRLVFGDVTALIHLRLSELAAFKYSGNVLNVKRMLPGYPSVFQGSSSEACNNLESLSHGVANAKPDSPINSWRKRLI